MSDGVTGDFAGKQFAEDAVAAKVQEQYGEKHARIFYKYVMGGGGLDIHYGVFRKATDGVYESSKATNRRAISPNRLRLFYLHLRLGTDVVISVPSPNSRGQAASPAT
jgi:hypothetical protein